MAISAAALFLGACGFSGTDTERHEQLGNNIVTEKNSPEGAKSVAPVQHGKVHPAAHNYSPATAQFTQIGDAEIRRRLTGRRLMNDRSLEQASIDFTEDFLSDGTWFSHRTERALVVLKGTWGVSSDELCVTVDNSAHCRAVWLDPATNKIAMLGLASSQRRIIILTTSSIPDLVE
jgi:hypothetical protein